MEWGQSLSCRCQGLGARVVHHRPLPWRMISGGSRKPRRAEGRSGKPGPAFGALPARNCPSPRPDHPTTRYSLAEIRPQSGRRRQIRRHFKHIFHPIGDTTYGEGRHNRFFRAVRLCPAYAGGGEAVVPPSLHRGEGGDFSARRRRVSSPSRGPRMRGSARPPSGTRKAAFQAINGGS